MAEKRHLTVATDISVEDILARVAEHNTPNPENELRLARLDAQHKIDHSSLTISQLQLIEEFVDGLIEQNKPVETPTRAENVHTRSVLRDASDRLVDETVQTPWQRQKDEFLKKQEESGDA